MSELQSRLEKFWNVEEKGIEQKSLRYQMKFMGKCMAVTLYLGSAIEEFANIHLGLNLCYLNQNGDEDIRAAYTSLFHNPSPTQQSISSKIKTEIESIPEIKSIDEIVDRFAKVYAAYCRLVEDEEDYEDYLAREDKAGLELLLSTAPVSKNYDKQLHKILVSHFEK